MAAESDRHLTQDLRAVTPSFEIGQKPVLIVDDDAILGEALRASALMKMASRVVLEITERSTIDAVKDIQGRVEVLRFHGFRMAIDDLGAGYAGLSGSSVRNNSSWGRWRLE